MRKSSLEKKPLQSLAVLGFMKHLLFLATALGMLMGSSWPPPAPRDSHSIKSLSSKLGLSYPPPNIRLTIDKSDRRMILFSGDTEIKRYRVGLGGAPAGPKRMEGDLKTPTGTYTVVLKNPRSAYHLFLGINYPNAADSKVGLDEARITKKQAERIQYAERKGARPSWSTPLGGAIGIHGGGGNTDWTLGCIAVSNAEIEGLWHVVKEGTPVVISE